MDRRTDLLVRVVANVDRISAGLIAGGSLSARHVRGDVRTCMR